MGSPDQARDYHGRWAAVNSAMGRAKTIARIADRADSRFKETVSPRFYQSAKPSEQRAAAKQAIRAYDVAAKAQRHVERVATRTDGRMFYKSGKQLQEGFLQGRIATYNASKLETRRDELKGHLKVLKRSNLAGRD